MDLRNPEYGQDRVTGKLLHGAAMSLDGGANVSEVVVDDSADELGVELLPERGGVSDVTEQRRDDLPGLDLGRGLGQRCATCPAEPETGWALCSAAFADDHGFSGAPRIAYHSRLWLNVQTDADGAH